MAASEFLQRMIRRIDRIERKHLENCAVDLIHEKEFLIDVLDAVPEAIAVLDDKGNATLLNMRFRTLFNVSEGNQPRTLPDIIRDAPLRQLIAQCVSTRRELFNHEIEVLVPRPMLLELTVTFPEEERRDSTIVTMHNLSQTELQVREQFKFQNWQSMLRLAAGIAHELGNPLNSLTIHLKLLNQILRREHLKQKNKIGSSLRVIADETGRLDRIVRNFLRATRGRPFRYEFHQIHDILKGTLSFMEPELKAAHINVEPKWDERIPLFLIDSERLHQAFVNVIKNAIQAMPKGGNLKLGTELQGNLCIITFSDTGTGIPASEVPHIFDAYYTTRDEGSGLGLMIVQQIVREHGGRVEVTSKPRKSTLFKFILPVRKKKLQLPEPRTPSK